MNGSRKSDSCVVPEKPPNKGCGAPLPAEGVEGRRLTKGNPGQQNRRRTQCRGSLHNELGRIRQAARRDERIPSLVCASLPEVGAQCGSSARWDLCGGRPERAVPTATTPARGPEVRSVAAHCSLALGYTERDAGGWG